MTLTDGEKNYTAIQIGTVMTDPKYRGQGLAKKLIERIIGDNEGLVEIIYLFANKSAVTFYPQFGFQRKKELLITLNQEQAYSQACSRKKLRLLSIDEDRTLIESIAKERVLLSNNLGVRKNESLLLFYFEVAFRDLGYYIEELNTIVFMEKEGHELHLFDVVSVVPISLTSILEHVRTSEITNIHFYFDPKEDIPDIKKISYLDEEDALFVKTSTTVFDYPVKLPITSHC